MALSEAVAGSGQAVKEKGRANLPMTGGCPSGVLGGWRGGSQVEAGLQARAGLEQDTFQAWVLEASGEECIAFSGTHGKCQQLHVLLLSSLPCFSLALATLLWPSDSTI